LGAGFLAAAFFAAGFLAGRLFEPPERGEGGRAEARLGVLVGMA
jgi:hypothetical protein